MRHEPNNSDRAAHKGPTHSYLDQLVGSSIANSEINSFEMAIDGMDSNKTEDNEMDNDKLEDPDNHLHQTSADFPLFPKLPVEMRLNIWRMAWLVDPHDIQARPRLATGTYDVNYPKCPSIFHTIRESRMIALEQRIRVHDSRVCEPIILD